MEWDTLVKTYIPNLIKNTITILKEDTQYIKNVNEAEEEKIMERTENYYIKLYSSMKVLPSWESKVDFKVVDIYRNKNKYLRAQELTTVDWRFIAIVHELESSMNFNCQLLNGQPWNRKTTIVPRNLGPWKSWEDSCIYALRHLKNISWSIPIILLNLERWNGLGYYNRKVHSPYLWSGSNHGVGVGKFVADGKYSKNAVSKQIGGALLLKGISL